MQISPAVLADLALLSDALDDPDADIAQSLQRLAADTKDAVASYLGLTITITTSGGPVVISAFEDGTGPNDSRSSLTVELQPRSSMELIPPAPITVVLYAANPGAFVDMAADLTWLGGGLIEYPLDLGLPPFVNSTPVQTVRGLSSINQAIGLLIAQGHTPEQARAHIDQIAAETGTDGPTAAGQLLGSILPLGEDPAADE